MKYFLIYIQYMAGAHVQPFYLSFKAAVLQMLKK